MLRRHLLLCGVALALALTPATAHAAGSGLIGPAQQITPEGHHLQPYGALTQLGNFTTGAAVSPDGRFLWTVDAGFGVDDVRIVQVATGKVVQVLPLAGTFGGIAFTPDGRHVYVSGIPSGLRTTGTPSAASGNALHVFDVDTTTGQATEGTPVTTASGDPYGVAVSPDGRYVATSLIHNAMVSILDRTTGAVTSGGVGEFPEGVVFDHHDRLWVANAYSGTLSVVDPATAKLAATVTGLGGAQGDTNSQPEFLALDPQRDRIYASITQRDDVAVVDTETRKILDTVSLARADQPEGVEPTGLTVSPNGRTLWVADSNEDALAAISLTDRPAAAPPVARPYRRGPKLHTIRVTTAALRREQHRYARLHHPSAKAKAAHRARVRRLARPLLGRAVAGKQCHGPTAASIATYVKAIQRALAGPKRVRLKGIDRARKRLKQVAACGPADDYVPGLKALSVIGRVPTAEYPTVPVVTPDGSRLLAVAAEGIGAGPNANFGLAFAGNPFSTDAPASPYPSYVEELLTGYVGIGALPGDRAVQAMTPAADAQTVPEDTETAPADTPLRPDGPIKHVFFVVRENRTYDQVFGSTGAAGDGDPSLELFDDNGVDGAAGGVTPNAHALARRFGLLDHVYSDSQVSVDGHLITSASIANDYTQRYVPQNYAGRSSVSQTNTDAISYAPGVSFFHEADQQGITYRNYGEISEIQPGPAGATDPNYPGTAVNSAAIPSGPECVTVLACVQDSGVLEGAPVRGAVSRIDEFNASFQPQVLAGSVPTFNYVLLPNDHTLGDGANMFSPKSMVADNDLGLGQLVSLVSHSSIWSSSAIFVVEDDSQDGADHIDAHRQPALVISPYSAGGTIAHRYDQYSALRSIELITGLKPLSVNDASAVPMYDAFKGTPDVTPYSAITPTQNLLENNPSSSSSRDLSLLSAALPFGTVDAVPEALSDALLWHSVHGPGGTAPLPGPGGSTRELGRAIATLQLLSQGLDPRHFLLNDDADDGDGPALAAKLGVPQPKLAADVRAPVAAAAKQLLTGLTSSQPRR